MYLGFSSKELDQNQITDLPDSRRPAQAELIQGVQRADILGGRTFAMRVWLKPERMAAMGISPSQVRDALAQKQLSLHPGADQGLHGLGESSVANTDLTTADEFRRIVVKQDKASVVRLGDIADVSLGAENYEQDVRFDGEGRHVHGGLGAPDANTLEVIRRVREAVPGIQAQLPPGMRVGIPYDSDGVHRERHPGGPEDAHGNAPHRRADHLPLPGLVPRR